MELALSVAENTPYAHRLRDSLEADPVLSERTIFAGFVDAISLNGFLNAADVGVRPKLASVTIRQGLGLDASWCERSFAAGSSALARRR